MENQTLLETIDPEIADRVVARREDISRGASVSSPLAAALAIGSVPIALAALAKDVGAQSASDVIDVLQFALLLEHLEAEFYIRGTDAAGLIPAADRTIFLTIRGHEITHVAALQQMIQAKGATPAPKPAFDFTAKGAVPNPFAAGNYAVFQQLAMAFEDTGVRAYKGQAGRLINDKATLTAALTIHSVEARHASEVRRLRGKKGWIVGNSREDLPAFTQPIYDGEQNTVHAGRDAAPLGTGNGGINAVTEAFDEPLTKAQVTAIVTPFLA
ncbi:MAG: ferritin-like domain-containing protein [Gemmatimonadota bacterium]|nr:ferritin-like domain-containing protein [Gemmatimonadota bacterium]